MLVRVAFVASMLALWFLTQKLLGRRGFSGQGIEDKIHVWTAGINRFLNQNQRYSRALLISSSIGIDCVGIYLLLGGIFGPSITPFLGLVIIFSLRQLSQYLTALPAPEGIIWTHPGVPSLLVTYHVSNDLFFSGHTALAIYGALQLYHTGSITLTLLGIFLALYEILAVLLLRAHWTMDIFAGAITAIMVDQFTVELGPWVDKLLQGLS